MRIVHIGVIVQYEFNVVFQLFIVKVLGRLDFI